MSVKVYDNEFKKREKEIWNALLNAIGNEWGVACLMGNMACESGLVTGRMQGDFSSGYSESKAYVKKCNSNKNLFVNDSVGFGLCQWTYWSRKQGLWEYCHNKGVSLGNLDAQVAYVVKELSNGSYSNTWSKLKNASARNYKTVVDYVCEKYEAPSQNNFNARRAKAKEIYDKYAKPRETWVYVPNHVQSGSSSRTIKNCTGKYFTPKSKINPFEVNTYEGTPSYSNCVWYAWGRFQQIAGGPLASKYGQLNGNAKDWIASAKQNKYKTGTTPKLGAIICWNALYGHVAVVEGIYYTKSGKISKILISHGGWSNAPSPGSTVLHAADNWHVWDGYTFKGFIYNPEVSSGSWLDDTSEGNPGGWGIQPSYRYAVKQSVETKKFKVEGDVIKEVEDVSKLDKVRSASLLSYPSMVEAPFAIVKIGKYTFGTYSEVPSGITNVLDITFPNFVKTLDIVKVNGTVNQYTLKLVYQVREGDDPNLVDKILGKVGYGGKIYFKYGDWSCPTLIYKEEEAIITKVTTQVDYASSKISYTVYATSSCLALAGCTFNFPGGKVKPSEEIKRILYDNKYGLLEFFPGMRDKKMFSKFVPGDDQVVKLVAKQSIDPISYLNYLVSCMVSATNNTDTVLLDSVYYLTIEDDLNNLYGGTYFKVHKVKSGGALPTANIYEVDVGFPNDVDNFRKGQGSGATVLDFKVNTDQSWALFYKHSENNLNAGRYLSKIDDNGNVYRDYVPAVVSSKDSGDLSQSARTWWTQMTTFPVTATLRIKGLIRPAMLMTYVRVNAFFYGQRHIASGVYIITKQEDSISSNGYRTTLSLTRIAGDNEYIENEVQEVTQNIVRNKLVKVESNHIVYEGSDDIFEKDDNGEYINKTVNHRLHGNAGKKNERT